MADFTHSDNYNLLPNLFVRSIFKNDIFKWYEIYPCNGYVLRCLYLDTFQIDEDGNFVLDENGNKILETPYKSEGGAMVLDKNYDWITNPCGYIAELYDETMEVFGKVKEP